MQGRETYEMKPRLRIVSYFSRPTDLANEMRGWPEFVTGRDYDVELRSTGECVATRFVDSEDQPPHVLIYSSGSGALLDRVAGCAIRALSADSDYVMVYGIAEA